MRIGWIVLGWTGYRWNPYYDTAARTRTEAIQKWREPLGGDGWPEYERRRLKGIVKAVRTHVFDFEPTPQEAGP